MHLTFHEHVTSLFHWKDPVLVPQVLTCTSPTRLLLAPLAKRPTATAASPSLPFLPRSGHRPCPHGSGFLSSHRMERVQASSFLMLSYLLAVQSFVPGQHRLGKGGEGKRGAMRCLGMTKGTSTKSCESNLPNYLANPSGSDLPLLGAAAARSSHQQPDPHSPPETTPLRLPEPLCNKTPCARGAHSYPDPREEWEGWNYFCFNYSRFNTAV